MEVDDQRFQTEGFEEGYTTVNPSQQVIPFHFEKSGDYIILGLENGDQDTDLVKYHKSSGFVDIRGGGRSSYRATIADVIAGAVARSFLKENLGRLYFRPIFAKLEIYARTNRYLLNYWVVTKYPRKDFF